MIMEDVKVVVIRGAAIPVFMAVAPVTKAVDTSPFLKRFTPADSI